VHFLAHGKWYSESPAFEIEREWGDWAAFSEGTSGRLATNSSFEVCDCVRPYETSERKENRYFHYRPGIIHVAFYQMIGGFRSRGLSLQSLGPMCSGTYCVQLGCIPGRCDDFSWNVSVPLGLSQHVADSFHPDTVVVNAGLWKIQRFTTLAKVKELKESGAFKRAGAQDVIWRTTTPTQLDNLTSEELPAAMEGAVLIPQLKASSVR
jgi:hypothetical protein